MYIKMAVLGPLDKVYKLMLYIINEFDRSLQEWTYSKQRANSYARSSEWCSMFETCVFVGTYRETQRPFFAQ